MKTPDLYGEITPAIGAAGFKIGSSIELVQGVSDISSLWDKNFMQITSDPARTNQNYKLLWSGIGTEDFLYKGTLEFNEYLSTKNIQLKTFTTDGGHTWMNVKKYLIQTLPLLFK